MLVLSRKPGEKLVLNGGEIVVTVVEVRGNRVKIGIDAPKTVKVIRGELDPLPPSQSVPAVA